MAPTASEAGEGISAFRYLSARVPVYIFTEIGATTEAAVNAQRFVDASFVAPAVFARLRHFSFAMAAAQTAPYLTALGCALPDSWHSVIFTFESRSLSTSRDGSHEAEHPIIILTAIRS
uniref:Uncharacterized protein n=1 Tax=Plectus sambesii TaxID=2011161 RepID=A0A914VZM7_9BILA